MVWRVKIQPTSEMTHYIPRMKNVINDLFYYFDILTILQALRVHFSFTNQKLSLWPDG